MTLKQEFDTLMKKSSNYEESAFSKRNEFYFNAEYQSDFKYELEEYKQFDKFKIREFTPVGKNDGKERLIKMCSISSSSRLAFLYFKKKLVDGYELEHECPNGLKTKIYPQLDAFDKKSNTYFECKCHEICDSHIDHLKLKYEEKLIKLFGFSKEELKECERTTEKGKVYEITLEQFGINKIPEQLKYTMNSSIYNLHLDVKQLICHLVGIENCNKRKLASLQYVFFTPNNIDIKKNPSINKLYDELLAEWKMIINSKRIKYLLKNCSNIKILRPKFIEIKKIHDDILNRKTLYIRDWYYDIDILCKILRIQCKRLSDWGNVKDLHFIESSINLVISCYLISLDDNVVKNYIHSHFKEDLNKIIETLKHHEYMKSIMHLNKRLTKFVNNMNEKNDVKKLAKELELYYGDKIKITKFNESGD